MISDLIATILFFIALAAICYALWLKYSARFGKPRFAMFAVTSIISLVLLLISALFGDFSNRIITLIIQFINYSAGKLIFDENISSYKFDYISTISIVVVILFSIYSVTKFSITAVKNWDGPPTITTSKLDEQGKGNALLALAFAEMQRIASRKQEIVISPTASNWRQQVAEPPNMPEWRQLARSCFKAVYREVEIDENGWRDQGNMWVGRIFEANSNISSSLTLFVRHEKPNIEEFIPWLQAEESKNRKYYLLYEIGPEASGETIELQDQIITAWSKNSILKNGLHLDSYARELIKQFTETTVGGTQVRLRDTFVPIKVKDLTGKVYLLQDIYDEWLKDTRRRHLSITGEYGQGKSTAMLQICASWAARYLQGQASGEPIPLLIELRGKNPAETDPISFLAQWGARYHLHADQVYNLIRAGHAVVIFEGFDELRNAGRAYERHEHFNMLWSFAYPGTKLLFTGRPNFFIDEKELNYTLRNDSLKGAASNVFSEIYRVSMFDIKDIECSCRSYSDTIRRGILNAASHNEHFLDIVARPSMLPVVATIWPDIKLQIVEAINVGSAILLEEYLAATYSRKEAELEEDRLRNRSSPAASYLLLPRSMREILTLCVVWRMAVQDAKNTISRSSFDEVVTSVLPKLSDALQSGQVPAGLNIAVRELVSRSAGELPHEWAERICNDVASAGLFVPDPAGGPSNLRFPHKQYFEYLVAKLVWLLLKRKESNQEQILNIIFNSSEIRGDLSQIISETKSMPHLSELIGDDFSFIRRERHVLKMVTFSLKSVFSLTEATLGRTTAVRKFWRKKFYSNKDKKSWGISFIKILRAMIQKRDRSYAYYISSGLVTLPIIPFIVYFLDKNLQLNELITIFGSIFFALAFFIVQYRAVKSFIGSKFSILLDICSYRASIEYKKNPASSNISKILFEQIDFAYSNSYSANQENHKVPICKDIHL